MTSLFISFEEGFFIILVAVLLFGPKKIPEIARGLGEGIRQLRNATQKIKQEIWEAGDKVEESEKQAKDEVREIGRELDKDFSGSVKRET
ncbi:MAG: twin-arginine translocase TatA/TatE family subunit [Flavobacteriales bacterium AspAUS03]